MENSIRVLDLLICEIKLLDTQKDQQNQGPKNKIQEELIIFKAHTSADPIAVMIHFQNAFVALTTVMSSVWLYDLTLVTESVVILNSLLDNHFNTNLLFI